MELGLPPGICNPSLFRPGTPKKSCRINESIANCADPSILHGPPNAILTEYVLDATEPIGVRSDPVKQQDQSR
jgi:hypothetical protein